jgi:hypothetical protein
MTSRIEHLAKGESRFNAKDHSKHDKKHKLPVYGIKLQWINDLIKEWNFDTSISIATQVLLQNPRYLQANPFKSLLHVLRNNEHIDNLLPALHDGDINAGKYVYISKYLTIYLTPKY